MCVEDVGEGEEVVCVEGEELMWLLEDSLKGVGGDCEFASKLVDGLGL